MVDINEVKAVCEDFMNSHQVQISEGAQYLILHTLNAVIFDPHPRWPRIDESERESHAREYLRRLPEALEFVTQQVGDTGIITSFDLLSVFSKLCDWFCFEEKVPQFAGAENRWRMR
jgi:hypothetical protein